jgi:ribosome-associated translation inhibitor RaiA
MAHDIDVTFDGARRILSDELREHAQKRLALALRRFQGQIQHVRLRFEDVNGPRRGVDARCLVVAQLTNGKRLVVEATTAWPTASVTQAVKRLAEVLRRSKWRT